MSGARHGASARALFSISDDLMMAMNQSPCCTGERPLTFCRYARKLSIGPAALVVGFGRNFGRNEERHRQKDQREPDFAGRYPGGLPQRHEDLRDSKRRRLANTGVARRASTPHRSPRSRRRGMDQALSPRSWGSGGRPCTG